MIESGHPRSYASMVRVIAVALAIFAIGRPCAAEDASTNATKAEELSRKGRELFVAQDYAGAYEAQLAAWQLKKSFDIAANLGQVELKLAKHRDAAEHLAYALDHFPARE